MPETPCIRVYFKLSRTGILDAAVHGQPVEHHRAWQHRDVPATDPLFTQLAPVAVTYTTHPEWEPITVAGSERDDSGVVGIVVLGAEITARLTTPDCEPLSENARDRAPLPEPPTLEVKPTWRYWADATNHESFVRVDALDVWPADEFLAGYAETTAATMAALLERSQSALRAEQDRWCDRVRTVLTELVSDLGTLAEDFEDFHGRHWYWPEDEELAGLHGIVRGDLARIEQLLASDDDVLVAAGAGLPALTASATDIAATAAAEVARHRRSLELAAERAAWVDAHASTRLRRLHAEYGDTATTVNMYLTERAQAEQPQLIPFHDLSRFKADRATSPPDGVLDLVDTARLLDPDASALFVKTPVGNAFAASVSWIGSRWAWPEPKLAAILARLDDEGQARS
ncbi:MAG TPA: hypothetical protein VMM13_09390 [Euzebya sp.]|nr:hypothetical protein [Euzebya sp.]